MDRKTRNILVVAISAGLATSGVFLSLTWTWISHPCGQGSRGLPTESLNVVSSRMNSPTNLTLVIVSSGTQETTLVSYIVRDAGGSYYSQSFNPQPVFCGQSVEYTMDVVLTGQVTGQPFTFQQGSSYLITTYTVHSQFEFTIIA
jgi:hypothetical protein